MSEDSVAGQHIKLVTVASGSDPKTCIRNGKAKLLGDVLVDIPGRKPFSIQFSCYSHDQNGIGELDSYKLVLDVVALEEEDDE